MRLKLASALVAALLVFGMVFGVGQAAAASLPGGPLYGLKLTAEQARMELTSDPEAKAELATELAENRLDEIGKMMAAGKTVDGATAHQAQQQLMSAYQAMNQVSGEGQSQFRHQLMNTLQNQHRVMASAVDGAPLQQQGPVQDLLRSMERLRAEVHAGEGEASGEQIRNNREELPQPPDPVGQPGAGPQAGQNGDDGLLDATGTQGGQGNQPDVTTPLGPSYGPGPENPEPPMDPYGGDGYGPGPDYGPGPAEPQEGTESPRPFGWLWQLFKKDSTSGSSSSGGSSSGSSSSGGSSSGSSSSGGSSSGSSSSGGSSSGGSSSGSGNR